MIGERRTADERARLARLLWRAHRYGTTKEELAAAYRLRSKTVGKMIREHERMVNNGQTTETGR